MERYSQLVVVQCEVLACTFYTFAMGYLQNRRGLILKYVLDHIMIYGASIRPWTRCAEARIRMLKQRPLSGSGRMYLSTIIY